MLKAISFLLIFFSIVSSHANTTSKSSQGKVATSNTFSSTVDAETLYALLIRADKGDEIAAQSIRTIRCGARGKLPVISV